MPSGVKAIGPGVVTRGLREFDQPRLVRCEVSRSSSRRVLYRVLVHSVKTKRSGRYFARRFVGEEYSRLF